MDGISGRLRTAITEDVTFNLLAVPAEEAADTIDALVAALEACVDKMGNSAPVHNDYWDAVEAGEAALALARGGR